MGETKAMNPRTILIFGSIGLLAMAGGCRKNSVDPGAFKSAINHYYSARPECVWTTPVKFPAQAETMKEDQTKGFDALVDAGFLTRTPAEKKKLFGSKQVNDYDLTDKGRSNWTADQTQPGYGNFCFGHADVTNVDEYSPHDNNATQYSVNYHYAVSHPAGWADSTEMKSAFPRIDSLTSGQRTGTATLVKGDNGWQVTNAGGSPASEPASAE